jgi:hypothetical protein
VEKFLTEDVEEITGGKFTFEDDSVEAAHKMISHIDKKREALKLRPMLNDQPFAPQESGESVKEVRDGGNKPVGGPGGPQLACGGGAH